MQPCRFLGYLLRGWWYDYAAKNGDPIYNSFRFIIYILRKGGGAAGWAIPDAAISFFRLMVEEGWLYDYATISEAEFNDLLLMNSRKGAFKNHITQILPFVDPPPHLTQFSISGHPPPLLSLLITLAALHIDTFLLFFYAYYLQFLYFFYLILSFWSDITYCVPSPQISLNYHSRSHPPHPYWWVIWLRFLNAPRTVKPSIVGQSCTADFISRKLIIQYNLVNIEFM